jgi:hypothetical protein
MDLILQLSKDEIDRVPMLSRSELQRKKLNIKEKEVIENALKFIVEHLIKVKTIT